MKAHDLLWATIITTGAAVVWTALCAAAWLVLRLVR